MFYARAAAESLRKRLGSLPVALSASASFVAASSAGIALGGSARTAGSRPSADGGVGSGGAHPASPSITPAFGVQVRAGGGGSAPKLPRPQVLFVLGGPGAGKGTQCARLVKEYGYVHLSAGDLLREERDSGSPDGDMIEKLMTEGKIVPVEVTVNLLRKAMERAAPHGGGKFLIDGFPRNFDNLDGWHKVMGSSADVAGVLFYDCPEAVMERRLLQRGLTSGRSDDAADVIRKRFHTYANATVPIIQHYAALGKTFRVDSDQSVDAVFAQTQRLLEPVIAAEVALYTQTLLDAIHAGDFELYEQLTDPGLTAIEAESNGELVKGLAFHKFYFDVALNRRKVAAAAASAAGKPVPIPSQSSMAPGTEVQLLSGTSAVVAGNRLVQREDRTDTLPETRVWRYSPERGLWRQVHFHRSMGLNSAAGAASKST